MKNLNKKVNNIANLEQHYTINFSKQLKKLTNLYTEKNNVEVSKIYKDLGLSESAYYNYMTDRLPQKKETIFAIKNYFDVSFDYLFGEIDTLTKKNTDISKKFRLSDSSIAMLEGLANNAVHRNDVKANAKINAINNFINNEKLLNLIADYSIKKDNYEKNKDLKLQEELEFLEFKLFKEFSKSLNTKQFSKTSKKVIVYNHSYSKKDKK